MLKISRNYISTNALVCLMVFATLLKLSTMAYGTGGGEKKIDQSELYFAMLPQKINEALPELLWIEGAQYWVLWPELAKITPLKYKDDHRTAAAILNIEDILEQNFTDHSLLVIRERLDALNNIPGMKPYYLLYQSIHELIHFTENQEGGTLSNYSGHTGHISLIAELHIKVESQFPLLKEMQPAPKPFPDDYHNPVSASIADQHLGLQHHLSLVHAVEHSWNKLIHISFLDIVLYLRDQKLLPRNEVSLYLLQNGSMAHSDYQTWVLGTMRSYGPGGLWSFLKAAVAINQPDIYLTILNSMNKKLAEEMAGYLQLFRYQYEPVSFETSTQEDISWVSSRKNISTTPSHPSLPARYTPHPDQDSVQYTQDSGVTSMLEMRTNLSLMSPVPKPN